jgi:hypothetical protein
MKILRRIQTAPGVLSVGNYVGACKKASVNACCQLSWVCIALQNRSQTWYVNEYSVLQRLELIEQCQSAL